jgi:hypothetical protein
MNAKWPKCPRCARDMWQASTAQGQLRGCTHCGTSYVGDEPLATVEDALPDLPIDIPLADIVEEVVSEMRGEL